MRQDVPGPPPPIVPPSRRPGDAARPDRLAAHARRSDRWPGDRRLQQPRRRPAARRRRSELVLSDRLLLERQARWKISSDFGPREAAGRAGARAPRLPGGDAGSGRRAGAIEAAADRAGGRRIGGGAGAHAVEAAIAPLAGYARDVPLRLQIAAGWKPGDAASAAMWVVGELGSAAIVGDSWNDGFDATVTVTTPADATVGRGRISVPRGGRDVPRRGHGIAAARARRLRAARRRARRRRRRFRRAKRRALTIPHAPEATGALFLRRGASTGEQRRADRRPAVPPQRAGPRRDSVRGGRSGDRAAAGSHRQGPGGSGDGGACATMRTDRDG